MSKSVQQRRTQRGFTLVELMVVVGIIAVLISVLIPVISRVRIRAYDADTRNWIQQLSAAVERYQSDYRAYPGPLADSQIAAAPFATAPFTAFNCTSAATGFATNLVNTQITGAENLTLGLLGGLTVTGTAPNYTLTYDPSTVGLGPMSLNPANPKRGTVYLDAMHLSWRTENDVKTGAFKDGTGGANDTIIPEFVDKYPGAEMPILYLRAKRGVQPVANGTAQTNSVITTGTAPTARVGTYDLAQVIGYTDTPIGEGKTVKAGDYAGGTSYPNHGLRTVTPNSSTNNPPPPPRTYIYPFDAFAYLESPQMPNTARNKDSYILISAGADRTYGTRDDIVSFGTVGE